MKIYFEEFGKGRDKVNSHLTPNKPYEVIKGSKGTPRIYNDVGTVVFVRLNTTSLLTNSVWKVWIPKKAEDNSMKIYFEKFGEGYFVDYLTPMKLYEVVEHLGNDETRPLIRDDEGGKILVDFNDDGHTRSSWKILSEEPKTQSAVDIVTSLESERSALVNSIDSVNELLDSMDVPKAETLRERVTLALTDKRTMSGTKGARIVQRSGVIDSCNYPLKPVRVCLKTESGEEVFFRAELDS